MAQDAAAPVRAGFISRAVAFIVDIIVMGVAILLVIALIQAILGFFTLYGVFGHTSAVASLVRNLVTAVIAVVSVVIAIGYPVGCWTLFGQTLGKALTGIRIVQRDNTPLTVRRALLRYVGYWVSALPFFLGFLWVLGDPQRLAWHDRLAGTCVIYTFPQAPTTPNKPIATILTRRKSDMDNKKQAFS